MRDPYLYPDCDILKNKLNKKTQKELNDAEANYVALRLRQVALSPLKGDYHTQHFWICTNLFFRICMSGQEFHVLFLYISRKVF